MGRRRKLWSCSNYKNSVGVHYFRQISLRLVSLLIRSGVGELVNSFVPVTTSYRTEFVPLPPTHPLIPPSSTFTWPRHLCLLFFDVIAIHLNKLSTEAPEKYFTFRVFCSLSCAVSDFDLTCLSSVLQRIGERYDVCRHRHQRETGGRSLTMATCSSEISVGFRRVTRRFIQ
jgi:hypothetical protein